MPFNNSVKNWRGQVIGFRCWECGDIVQSMWGEICNKCRGLERRHQELLSKLSGDISGDIKEKRGGGVPPK